MQFSSLFVAAATLIAGSQAAAIPRSDPHIVDFRTYGQPGCSAANQGVYTYTESQTGTCNTFADDTVQSIYITDITEGCNVYTYTTPSCNGTQTTVPVGVENCYSYSDGLVSYKVAC